MDFFLYILTLSSIFTPIALGYTMVFGRGRILHFGPIGMALGAAYGVFIVTMATGNFALGLISGAAVTAVLSLVFTWLSLRLTPDGLGVMSIAVHLAILQLVLNWQSLTRGALGIPRIPRLEGFASPGMFAALAIGVCVVWIAFFLWLERTAFWRQLSALGEQEWYAKSVGISKLWVYAVALLILGATALSDNFLYPQFLHLLYPNDYQFPNFILLILTVVAGKPGSVRGVVVASVLVTFIKEGIRFLPIASDFLGPVRLLVFGLILLIAVWLQRNSLFPQKRTV